MAGAGAAYSHDALGNGLVYDKRKKKRWSGSFACPYHRADSFQISSLFSVFSMRRGEKESLLSRWGLETK